ncbi:hypothetical protein ABEB36_006074 [Hypothenemus hampei]|uniref:Zinc finger CCHC domain-containing protein 10 n=1 Tax=Hypothenemus hampei TaxID=57062 RepID=A0ABD1F0D7_HYPHA
MTLDSSSSFSSKRKKPSCPPQGVRCQKCLEYGHWSYECKGERKYLHRTSRTQLLRKRLKAMEGGLPNADSTQKKKDNSERVEKAKLPSAATRPKKKQNDRNSSNSSKTSKSSSSSSSSESDDDSTSSGDSN